MIPNQENVKKNKMDKNKKIRIIIASIILVILVAIVIAAILATTLR